MEFKIVEIVEGEAWGVDVYDASLVVGSLVDVDLDKSKVVLSRPEKRFYKLFESPSDLDFFVKLLTTLDSTHFYWK